MKRFEKIWDWCYAWLVDNEIAPFVIGIIIITIVAVMNP